MEEPRLEFNIVFLVLNHFEIEFAVAGNIRFILNRDKLRMAV